MKPCGFVNFLGNLAGARGAPIVKPYKMVYHSKVNGLCHWPYFDEGKGFCGLFGYVTPAKPEMKVREFESYRSVYCGLCKQLKRDYGFASRMLLNYDLVTVALLADGLSGEEGRPCAQRCIASPLRKRCMLQETRGLRLAAAALVLLSWYKLADDVADETLGKRLAARAARLALRGAHKKAAAAFPDLDGSLAAETARQQKLEAEQSQNPDEAAEPTGRMTGAIFALCAENEAQVHILQRLGLFLGKILYWLDAAEDYGKDAEKGRYNVFRLAGLEQAQAVERTKVLCRMAAGEAARCYNLLDLRLNRPIFDNIIFLGLPASIVRAGQPPQHTKHAAIA